MIPPLPQLLKYQQLSHDFVERRVLDLLVLLGADQLFLRTLDLIGELAKGGHVRIVHDRLAVNRTDLPEATTTLTGDIHSPLEDHESHECDRCK